MATRRLERVLISASSKIYLAPQIRFHKIYLFLILTAYLRSTNIVISENTKVTILIIQNICINSLDVRCANFRRALLQHNAMNSKKYYSFGALGVTNKGLYLKVML